MRDDAEELKAFGLSGYEAAAYAAVLGLGACEAAAVAQRGGIPTGRIYDVLNGLVEKRLLVVEDVRPKKYRALPPTAALAELLNARRREFDERYESLARLATELERKLQPRRPDRAASAFHQVAVGETEARAVMAERAREARREILLTLRFERPMPIDADVFRAYADAARRGVEVRALVQDADIPRLIESPYNELIADTILPLLGDGVDVRVVEEEQAPFAVIDREKAFIGVKNPLDPHAYFALIYLWDPAFAKELGARFDSLWNASQLDVGALVG